LDKLFVVGFIALVEEATWLSPIVVVLKKNGKPWICVDICKLNVATKKDPYPLPFTKEVFDMVASHDIILFLGWLFRLPSDYDSFRGSIQNCIHYRLGAFSSRSSCYSI